MRYITPICISMALFYTPSLLAESNEGKELHDESCISCHAVEDHTALYTSKSRKVDSLHKLGGQVSACTQALGVEWFPEDEKKVVKFLNEDYYKFPEK